MACGLARNVVSPAPTTTTVFNKGTQLGVHLVDVPNIILASIMIMGDIEHAPMAESPPNAIPEQISALQIPPSSVQLPPSSSGSRIRNSYITLDTFSPVNQNGSFEFDRVLKAGYVQKRTRKTKVRDVEESELRALTGYYRPGSQST